MVQNSLMQPLSLRLWRTLRRRTSLSRVFDSTIYRRMTPPRALALPARVEQFRELIMALLLSIGCVFQLFLVFPVIALFLASGVVGGTLAGIVISANAAVILAYERAAQRLDVFSIAPAGGFVVCWTLIAEFMRKSRALNGIDFFTRTFFTLGGLVGGGLFIVSLIGLTAGTPDYAQLSAEIQSMVILLVGLYLDYHFSIVTAVLAALIVMSPAVGRSGGMVTGVIGFLTIQALFYAVFGVLGLFGVEVVVSLLQSSDRPALQMITAALLRLVLYILMRESLVHLLWRQVQRALNTDASELRQIDLGNEGRIK